MGLFTKKKKKQPPKRKNVSQKVRNGTTLQTRDEFLESGKNYKKPGYENKGLYRKVVVVDSNRKDELAVVKLSTKGKHKVSNYKNNKSTYKPIIETKDNKSKPIKIGTKFKKNKDSDSISKSSINKIKKDCLVKTKSKTKKNNARKLKQLKNR